MSPQERAERALPCSRTVGGYACNQTNQLAIDRLLQCENCRSRPAVQSAIEEAERELREELSRAVEKAHNAEATYLKLCADHKALVVELDKAWDNRVATRTWEYAERAPIYWHKDVREAKTRLTHARKALGLE